MNEPDKPSSQVRWVSMLVLAVAFAGLGVWGFATGQVAWGIGSVLFGLVWGFAALKARRNAEP